MGIRGAQMGRSDGFSHADTLCTAPLPFPY